MADASVDAVSAAAGDAVREGVGDVGRQAAGPRARVVGTGLIGTSLGLALTRAGWRVTLADPSPTACALAADMGAGSVAAPGDPAPDVVVVGAPPDVAGAVVLDALATWPDAVVTDVASVKSAVADAVCAGGGDLTRYVGSHPMAGRERSGAVAARRDLFEGRAWVVVPTPSSSPDAVALVTRLARDAGGQVTTMPPGTHDAAVAAVSHVPQVMASLTAGALRRLDEASVALAGQGVRDVTRIAGSDPQLWTQILAGNAGAVADVLRDVAVGLADTIDALDALAADGAAPGARGVVARVVADGNSGRALLPGKHGSAPTRYAVLTVVVPDSPGALARLLADVGSLEVNLEDLHLEHALGHEVGLAEIAVLPAAAERLAAGLADLGWRVHP